MCIRKCDIEFVGTFAILRNSYGVRSICPCLRTKQIRNRWTYANKISYWRILRNVVELCQFLFIADMFNNNFT
jgi:hypothetical protein